MKRTSTLRWSFALAIAVLVGVMLLPTLTAGIALAQDPAAPGATATATDEPPTNTPTSTITQVPTATDFPATPTATPRPKATPKPVPIPEPVTVVLFGTGLAALSAAVATRRKKND